MQAKQTPLVSVIVQTFQHAPYIRECLNSILAQKTNFSFELIIGEDESSDGTRQICEEYANQYSDIIRLFLRSRESVIYIGNVPTGRYNLIENIKAAKGKYIAICEGDDYWTDENKLQKQVDFLENNHNFSSSCHETLTLFENNNTGKIYGRDLQCTITAEHTINTSSPFHTSSFMFKKECFPDIIPHWIFKVFSGDMALFSIISKRGPIGKISEVMSVYRKHSAGLTELKDLKDNFHQNRIILINFLNEYHDFKYQNKASDVIAYHNRQIIYNNANSINKLANKNTILNLFNNDESLKYQKISTPPTMLNYSEIQLLYWISKSIYRSIGALVELGPWLGGSTTALAKGICDNSNIKFKKIYSYDNFIWTAWYDRYNLGIKKTVGESFFDIFLENTMQYRDIIDIKHGDVCKIGWNGTPIELIFIDIIKSQDTARCVAHSFFPSLIPGSSIIIHQDYKHYNEFWIHLLMYRLREHFTPIINLPDAPTVVFKHTKILTHYDIKYACDFDTFTTEEIDLAFQYSLDISHGSNKIFIDEIKKAHNKAADFHKSINTKNLSSKKSARNNSTIMNDKFLNISFTEDYCDLYIIRKAIKDNLNKSIHLLHDTILDVGCGQMPYKEFILNANPKIKKYIGLDFAYGKYATLNQPDITWDGNNIPLEDNSVDCAMATEVLEHCPNPLATLKEIRRALRPDGVFFFTVPFLWPLHDTPHDHYRYTPFSLKRLLTESGFEDIEINALGGWNASLAQMIGLWLKRAPMHDEMRRQMTNQLFPLYKQLIELDSNIQQNEDNCISPGWSGIAYKSFNKSKSKFYSLSERNLTNLCIVRTDQFVYSETFIEDHINHISDNITVIHGEPYPYFDRNKKCIIEPQFIKSIHNSKSGVSYEIFTEAFSRFLNKNKFDVILAEFGNVGAKIYKACEQSGIPYVVHFHGYDATAIPTLRQFEREYHAFFKSAAALVVVSNAMLEKILEFGAPKDKVILNPYGVDISREDLAFPENSLPIFLAVGRFVEKKAPHLTIQAFSKTAKAFPHARLIMVGDGPLLNSCQELAEHLNILDQVHFTGIHSRRSVAKLMRQSRAFVQHSMTAANGDTEGLPLAILEAGAAGLPVISTRHAGIPDAVIEGENGFLVNEGDVEKMSEAMLSIAKSPRLAGWMGKNYRQRVVDHFSREKSIQGLQAILESAKSSKH
ncbi:MAG: glycosyltransferase [Desulfomicrobium sp.]